MVFESVVLVVRSVILVFDKNMVVQTKIQPWLQDLLELDGYSSLAETCLPLPADTLIGRNV